MGFDTLALREAVGATGACVGVDVSSAQLDVAKCSAATRGFDGNVRFVLGDAQTQDFRKLGVVDYDLVYSRFGVMFFDDSERAFANLATTLRKLRERERAVNRAQGAELTEISIARRTWHRQALLRLLARHGKKPADAPGFVRCKSGPRGDRVPSHPGSRGGRANAIL